MKKWASRVREKIAIVSLLVLFFPSYVVSQETDSTDVGLNWANYVSYIQIIQKKVQSTWKYPPGIMSGNVALRFVLDIDGNLMSVQVLNSSDVRLSDLAIEAMNRASPFPPIPDNLKRLAGEPLVIKFTVKQK